MKSDVAATRAFCRRLLPFVIELSMSAHPWHARGVAGAAGLHPGRQQSSAPETACREKPPQTVEVVGVDEVDAGVEAFAPAGP